MWSIVYVDGKPYAVKREAYINLAGLASKEFLEGWVRAYGVDIELVKRLTK